MDSNLKKNEDVGVMSSESGGAWSKPGPKSSKGKNSPKEKMEDD